MNNKLLVILLFMGWSFLCWRIYVCQIKQVCPGKTPKLTVTSPPVDTRTEVDAIDSLATAPEAHPEETTTSAIAPTSDDTANTKTKAAKIAGKKEVETTTSAGSGNAPEDHVSIEETADEAVIHFPFNSTRKIDNQEMDAYLTKLATRLKGSGEKVLITGHTDGIGDSETNNTLALKRAQSIREVLVKKGVSAKSITCRSFGERKPVASDDTPQGRYKNRRAILTVQ